MYEAAKKVIKLSLIRNSQQVGRQLGDLRFFESAFL
jgi:hypothetical protein